MKALATLLVFIASFASFSQTYYEGTAKVIFKTDAYATIVFSRNGYSPTSFIVKEPRLKEGHYYYFMLKTVKFKGTKETAKILLFHKDARQQTIERRKVRDSVNQKFIWT